MFANLSNNHKKNNPFFPNYKEEEDTTSYNSWVVKPNPLNPFLQKPVLKDNQLSTGFH